MISIARRPSSTALTMLAIPWSFTSQLASKRRMPFRHPTAARGPSPHYSIVKLLRQPNTFPLWSDLLEHATTRLPLLLPSSHLYSPLPPFKALPPGD
ncbi:hypothetical protein AXF42_Ash021031 [Apostasia shenzhenica]|uniref:Uncharacterized protein n=1 Tax=Apostasia shenzhenica TaxID=1088818 RepID=A0A2I0AE06_9ASPA|nr:hypothetical protein AXF42_Ash021031 [Apostasia shenzhenica]